MSPCMLLASFAVKTNLSMVEESNLLDLSIALRDKKFDQVNVRCLLTPFTALN